MSRAFPLLVAILLVSACSAPSETTSDVDSAAFSVDPASTADGPEMFGGCILAEPLGEVPEDPRWTGPIESTDEYPPFTKKMMVNGLLLVAGEDASDDFLKLVATAIEEHFPADESLDLETQAEILRNLYRYRSVIPVPVGEDFDFFEHPDFEQTAANNSVCDIIMEGVPGQVMEVVEHILHYVSDTGLHYTFPAEWGISANSVVNQGMEEAIEKGYYDVTQYQEEVDASGGEINDEEYHRILIQEFAYWLITTYWDLQEDYGPVGEAEWHIVTSAELKEKLPDLWAMVDETVGRTMAAPTRETLQAIGPTRAEERAAEAG